MKWQTQGNLKKGDIRIFFFPYMCATTFNTHNKPYESNQVKMTWTLRKQSGTLSKITKLNIHKERLLAILGTQHQNQ